MTKAESKICIHCNRCKAVRPRQLCWTCYYTPGVKDGHAPCKRHRPDLSKPKKPDWKAIGDEASNKLMEVSDWMERAGRLAGMPLPSELNELVTLIKLLRATGVNS